MYIKLSDELKKKIVDFLMNGKDEMIAVYDYGVDNKDVFTREELENDVNGCDSFGALEFLIFNDYALSMKDMRFGDALDAI